MKELVEYIAKCLVSNKDSVEIYVSEGKTQVITIKVDKDDMGKIIGKNGKIAQSIRTIVKSVSNKGEKVIVKIEEKE